MIAFWMFLAGIVVGWAIGFSHGSDYQHARPRMRRSTADRNAYRPLPFALRNQLVSGSLGNVRTLPPHGPSSSVASSSPLGRETTASVPAPGLYARRDRGGLS